MGNNDYALALVPEDVWALCDKRNKKRSANDRQLNLFYFQFAMLFDLQDFWTVRG